VVHTIDGVRLEGEQPVPAALRAAGAAGWELVNVAADGADWLYTFKRSKE
jgi:hypothetical protein